MNDPDRRPPFPSPLLAFGLTSLALMGWLMGAILFMGLGNAMAVGMGSVLGLGALGSVAARFVPTPSDVRLGFRPLPLDWLLPILLLVPLVLWMSELDNWITFWAPHELPAETVERSPLVWVEAGIVSVLLAPLLQEFFFRGVLLQGVADSMRPLAACLFVGSLSALFAAAAFGNTPVALSALAQGVVTGTLFGVLRLASGSLFVPVALHAAMAAAGFLAVAYEESLPIPGFNAPGDHTPASWLIGAGLAITAGLVLLRQRWLEREPLPMLPVVEEDDEEDGPFF